MAVRTYLKELGATAAVSRDQVRVVRIPWQRRMFQWQGFSIG